MTLSLHDRYRGTLVGVLAGDSLGAPYEKWEPEAIALDLEKRGGLVPFSYDDPWGRSGHFPAGRPTDDSELTAALAQSLIECGHSNPSHQYQLFKRAVGGESFVWHGKADGFGRTTRKMLKAPTYEEAQQEKDPPVIASNGSLMRSAPLGLYYLHTDWQDLIEVTRRSSRVTHIHEASVECSVLYVQILRVLLLGANPSELLPCIKEERLSVPEVAALFAGEELPCPPETNVWLGKGGLAGSALHTLHIALWCVLHAKDFRDGIEKAVRFGGDTDTAAAVTGSLLGAQYGVEGIPVEWRDILQGVTRMQSLADQIYYAVNA